MKNIKLKQSGFTLVEIAIVLVIIGLLLGGVLKGQEMVDNAKIKNVVNDMKGVSAAYYSYLDRYKAVPGDDILASTHFTGAVNGGGNGAITGVYSAVTPLAAAAESNNFWQHTRMAGFMNGSATATVALPPNNAAGGFLGVQSQVSAAGGSTYGMTGPVVCAGSVPWKIAQAVDAQLDDGDSATGNVRAGLSGATNLATAAATANVYGPAVPATPALEAGMHTVCMKL
ncbi:prepilin-type N-terminal cleavage/methylation domain-containing protein [Propionivibrio sp.]|uniref:prepilin-type N-terminal cleavage/methylation domain-containing protein n=1 Tax=Propionivibrio sp. TaxID=2212460 RepID=UPI003BF3F95F